VVPLGSILVRRGVLTEEQLAAALAEQRQSGEKLGEVLVRLGFTVAPTVGLGLAAQHGRPLKTEYGYAISYITELGSGDSAPEPPVSPPTMPLPEAAVTEMQAADENENAEAAARSARLERELAEARARIAQLEVDQSAPTGSERADYPHEAHATDRSHLLFAPVSNGYLLFEQDGPPPQPESLLEFVDEDGVSSCFFVAEVGAPPLPGVTLACAYLVEAD
jgi:hypothetical protein